MIHQLFHKDNTFTSLLSPHPGPLLKEREKGTSPQPSPQGEGERHLTPTLSSRRGRKDFTGCCRISSLSLRRGRGVR